MTVQRTTSTLRLAELLAALSLGIDLGFGQPMEHILRQCLISLRLAERLDLDDEQRSAVYYTSLLVNVGCHSTRTSRRSGSATTSPSRRRSTRTSRAAWSTSQARCGGSARAAR